MQCYPGYRYSLKRNIHTCLNSLKYTPPIGECVLEESNDSAGGSITHCPTPEIPNSMISTSPVLIDTWVKVVCASGYSYSRNNYLHYCQGDGKYNLEFGECVEDQPLGKCSQVRVLNGKTKPDSEVSVRSLVEVICNDGYTYSKSSAIHFCGTNLQFEPELGECTPTQCPELKIKNAIVVPTSKPKAYEKVFIICVAGHKYVGRIPVLNCLSNGSYDGVIGFCVNKDDPNKSLDEEFIEAGFLTNAVIQIYTEANESDNDESHYNQIPDDSDSQNQLHTEVTPTKNNQVFTNGFSRSQETSYITESNSVTDDNRIVTEEPTSELLYSTPDYGNDPSLVTPNMETETGNNTRSSDTDDVPDQFFRNGTEIPNQVATSEPNNVSNEILDETTPSGMSNVTCSPVTLLHGTLVPAGEVPASTEVKVQCDEGYLYNKSKSELRCGEAGSFDAHIGSCVPKGEHLM
jgi:hypothetical protein